MPMGFLTSQNSKGFLTVNSLFGTIELENFATDKMITVEASKPTQGSKSADGKFSAAALPQTFRVTITLRANSANIPYINQWNDAIKSGQEVVPSEQLTFTAPSLGQTAIYTDGTLEEFTAFPDANGQYEEISFVINYGDADTTNG